MKETEQSLVGDLINFRGLVYSPLNENGVVFLFGKVAGDLNMYVEEIKPGFPDCIARRFTGKGWERLRVEFEYKSSNFKQHGHDPNGCDMIICWEHDWKECPLEVIELKDRIKEMENPPIERPDAVIEDNDIDKWFDKFQVKDKPRKIFHKLSEYVKSLDESCFYKIGKTNVSFYCPERVFILLFPREKWGGLSISSEEELTKALPWIEKSYKRINKAIKNNEPTGWYAKADEVDSED